MDLRAVLRSCNLQKLENTEVFKRLETTLKEEKWYKPVLDFSEDSSNLNRVYIVTGCAFLFFSSLLYHFGIQLICGVVGFLYPGYETVMCLEGFDIEKGKKWLKYWLVFSTFNFLEILFFFLHWLPGYWIVKCIFYAWCFAPIPTNGSEVIYKFLIRPYFNENQDAIEKVIESLMNTAHIMSSEPHLNFVKNAGAHQQ